MNVSKDRFSVCSVGTSMLFTKKCSGLLVTCKLIYIKESPPATLFLVLMKEVALQQFPWLCILSWNTNLWHPVPQYLWLSCNDMECIVRSVVLTEVFISSSSNISNWTWSYEMFSDWYLQVITRDLPRWSAYSSGGNSYSLKCHFFVISYFLYIFHNYDYIFLFGQNRLSGTILPICTLHLWENLSLHYIH
jgi:hypothetical protein